MLDHIKNAVRRCAWWTEPSLLAAECDDGIHSDRFALVNPGQKPYERYELELLHRLAELVSSSALSNWTAEKLKTDDGADIEFAYSTLVPFPEKPEDLMKVPRSRVRLFRYKNAPIFVQRLRREYERETGNVWTVVIDGMVRFKSDQLSEVREGDFPARGPAAMLLYETLAGRFAAEKQERKNAKEERHKRLKALLSSWDLIAAVRGGRLVFTQDPADKYLSDGEFYEGWTARVDGTGIRVRGVGKRLMGVDSLREAQLYVYEPGQSEPFEVKWDQAKALFKAVQEKASPAHVPAT